MGFPPWFFLSSARLSSSPSLKEGKEARLFYHRRAEAGPYMRVSGVQVSRYELSLLFAVCLLVCCSSGCLFACWLVGRTNNHHHHQRRGGGGGVEVVKERPRWYFVCRVCLCVSECGRSSFLLPHRRAYTLGRVRSCACPRRAARSANREEEKCSLTSTAAAAAAAECVERRAELRISK